MDKQSLIDMLQLQDDAAKAIGLPKTEYLHLVITRKNPPKGYKIKTPFGLCDIANCQQKPDGYQTVFRVSRKQIDNLIKNWNTRAPIGDKNDG